MRLWFSLLLSLWPLLLSPLPVRADPPAPAGLGLEPTPPAERVMWNKTPLPVTLAVGRERQVRFPRPVQVGLPASLSGVLRSQSVDDTVYWQASAPFPVTRVLVKELDGGRLYLLDVRAIAGTPAGPPLVISAPATSVPSATVPVAAAAKAGEAGAPTASEGAFTGPNEVAVPPAPGYAELTRFAAQQVYAPTRLLHELPGVSRTPVTGKPVALVRGGAVAATPLAMWRSADAYVTAVKLRNRTAQPVVLDPRDLRGAWLTATFQHARLLPAGSEADTTTVYLISARPFQESLP